VKCKSSKEQGRLMSTAGTTPSLAKTPYWENTQPHIKTNKSGGSLCPWI